MDAPVRPPAAGPQSEMSYLPTTAQALLPVVSPQRSWAATRDAEAVELACGGGGREAPHPQAVAEPQLDAREVEARARYEGVMQEGERHALEAMLRKEMADKDRLARLLDHSKQQEYFVQMQHEGRLEEYRRNHVSRQSAEEGIHARIQDGEAAIRNLFELSKTAPQPPTPPSPVESIQQSTLQLPSMPRPGPVYAPQVSGPPIVVTPGRISPQRRPNPHPPATSMLAPSSRVLQPLPHHAPSSPRSLSQASSRVSPAPPVSEPAPMSLRESARPPPVAVPIPSVSSPPTPITAATPVSDHPASARLSPHPSRGRAPPATPAAQALNATRHLSVPFTSHSLALSDGQSAAPIRTPPRSLPSSQMVTSMQVPVAPPSASFSPSSVPQPSTGPSAAFSKPHPSSLPQPPASNPRPAFGLPVSQAHAGPVSMGYPPPVPSTAGSAKRIAVI
eukprot:TRINITY_DN25426_c0_g1_i1.p1 TRINITY_DN25426_c0_g1~~TRINITY_DN25426_c0_g1_i1.p1  ORF type:complete len:485 (+),score=100.47 TRINITY_DN25426_c0_g1_i1:114-1457(+)